MNTRKVITFRMHCETEFDAEVVPDAPLQGDFEPYADYVLSRYEVVCSPADAKACLKRYGAWDEEELQDHEWNVKRLLWLSILDCKENESLYWYMGE